MEAEEGEILDDVGSAEDQAVCSEDEEMELKAALPIASFSGTFTIDSIPSTGEEYLCLVRQQRLALPKVASSPSAVLESKSLESLISTPYTSPATRPDLLPTREWEEAMVHGFMLERESWRSHLTMDYGLEEIPSIIDETGWRNFLYSEHDPKMPSPSIIGQLTHPAKLRLILYLSRWSQAGLTKEHFLWLQSLIANIELGLCSTDLSILRSLAKKAIEQRAALTDPIDWDLLPRLNAIIVIVGRVYQQSDLLS
jgi:hypothetical protein